jgi:hypothetical protein
MDRLPVAGRTVVRAMDRIVLRYIVESRMRGGSVPLKLELIIRAMGGTCQSISMEIRLLSLTSCRK